MSKYHPDISEQSFDINNQPEEVLLDMLASLVVKIYLRRKCAESNHLLRTCSICHDYNYSEYPGRSFTKAKKC